jgi:hypothetical protein
MRIGVLLWRKVNPDSTSGGSSPQPLRRDAELAVPGFRRLNRRVHRESKAKSKAVKKAGAKSRSGTVATSKKSTIGAGKRRKKAKRGKVAKR